MGLAGGLAFGAISALILGDADSVTRVTLGVSVSAALLNILAIPFFLSGLKNFKSGLKRACIVLCVGIGLFGLAQVQLPFISLFEWGFWINSGGIAIPYLLGVIGIFWGIRLFARLVSVKSLFGSPISAFIATIVISIGAATLPHIHTATDELAYDLALALSVCNSVVITFATVLTFKLRQKIGLAYTRSMTWLFAALAIIAFAGWHYTIIQLTMTTGDWYYDYSFTIIPFVAGAIALVLAGYSFNAINIMLETDSKTAPAKNQRKSKEIGSGPLELEIVLYVAGLISNPTEVDVILDDVRLITAGSHPAQHLSSKDQQTLGKVYIQLEDYLVHKDALRIFTLDGLRSSIAKRFALNDRIRMLLWHEHS